MALGSKPLMEFTPKDVAKAYVAFQIAKFVLKEVERQIERQYGQQLWDWSNRTGDRIKAWSDKHFPKTEEANTQTEGEE